MDIQAKLTKLGVKPNIAQTYADPINKLMSKYNVTTDNELNALIATAFVETGFTNITENLYYTSADRLCAVFKSKFKTPADAAPYTRNPRKLADYVYASRGGYAFIGRGLVQLTGKANYEAFKRDTGHDVIANPDLLTTNPEICAESLFWYFKVNGLYALAKLGDWRGVRRAVNGPACLGLDEFKNAVKTIT